MWSRFGLLGEQRLHQQYVFGRCLQPSNCCSHCGTDSFPDGRTYCSTYACAYGCAHGSSESSSNDCTVACAYASADTISYTCAYTCAHSFASLRSRHSLVRPFVRQLCSARR